MTRFHSLDAAGRKQVQTISKVDCCAHDIGCNDLVFPGLQFCCELQAARVIGLPEVAAVSQPVIVVVAGLEGIAGD